MNILRLRFARRIRMEIPVKPPGKLVYAVFNIARDNNAEGIVFRKVLNNNKSFSGGLRT